MDLAPIAFRIIYENLRLERPDAYCKAAIEIFKDLPRPTTIVLYEAKCR